MKAAFTVITNNYISYAKTLGDSLKKHNPNYTFFICSLDDKADLKNTGIDLSDFSLIDLSELSDKEDVQLMRNQFDVFELSCALKPYFAEHILKYKAVEKLKYLDSDIMVFNSFNPTLEADIYSNIFLTAHFFKPVETEPNRTDDSSLIKSGIYNAGFFEVNNSNVALSFLKWWKTRVRNTCFFYKRPFQHINVDQSWLNLAPIYFEKTKIIDNLGYNTSFFNLHERHISRKNDCYVINENEPLVFFHYTGYKYDRHEKASVYNQTFTYQNTPFLEDICDEYRQALIANSIESILPPSKTPHIPVGTKIVKTVNQFLKKFLKVKIVRADD